MNAFTKGHIRELGLDANPYYIKLEGRDRNSVNKLIRKNNVFFDTYKNALFASKLNQKQMTKKLGRGYLELDKNPEHSDSQLTNSSISQYWLPKQKTMLTVVGKIPSTKITKKYKEAWRLKDL